MTDGPEGAGSAPCFAHELVDGEAVDPVAARDVATFRRAERQRLLGLRRALGPDERRRQAGIVAGALEDLLELPGLTVSAYWPIRFEPDLRPWMSDAHAAGACIVLPVVVAPDAPLAFRVWRPGCRMVRGTWNIPVPADADERAPDVVLAPLVGVDGAGYRLGNGGGYFDRTLAAAGPHVRPVGVGYDVALMRTIFPMPWDVPMHDVVLGDGTVESRNRAVRRVAIPEGSGPDAPA